MTWLDLTVTLLKSSLLFLATMVLRDLWFTSPLTADIVASNETLRDDERTRGFTWFKAWVLSCSTCITYWIALLCGLSIFLVPATVATRWASTAPMWLLGCFVAAWFVNKMFPDPGKTEPEPASVTSLKLAPKGSEPEHVPTPSPLATRRTVSQSGIDSDEISLPVPSTPPGEPELASNP